MRSRFIFVLACCAAVSSTALAQWMPLDPVTAVKQTSDGLEATMRSGGVLKLTVCSDTVIHVTYSPSGKFQQTTDYVVTKQTWPAVKWKLDSSENTAVLSTDLVKITLDKAKSEISFAGTSGAAIFHDSNRIMTPVTVNGEKTYRAETVVAMYGTHEGFYGLGQHQAGVWNYHGESVDLSQENTNIAITMLLSSKGYGIYWNNTSRSRVNNRFVHVMYFSSEVADSVDYYFIYGPDFDKIIAGY